MAPVFRAGRYIVEAVDVEAPPLSLYEEAGIEAAPESYVRATWSMPSALAKLSTQPTNAEGSLTSTKGQTSSTRPPLVGRDAPGGSTADSVLRWHQSLRQPNYAQVARGGWSDTA